MNWPDLKFPALNLPIVGSDPNLIPDADCGNCKYNISRYGEGTKEWCYMFEKSPGSKCGQFRKIK